MKIVQSGTSYLVEHPSGAWIGCDSALVPYSRRSARIRSRPPMRDFLAAFLFGLVFWSVIIGAAWVR